MKTPRPRAEATLRLRMDADRVARRMEKGASCPMPIGGDLGENEGRASGSFSSKGPFMASSDDLVAAMTSRLRSINAAGYSQGEVDVDVVGPKFSTHQMIGRYEIKIAQACFPEARGLESDCELVCRGAVTGSLRGEGRVREWILGKLKVRSWPFERNVSAMDRDKSRNTPYGGETQTACVPGNLRSHALPLVRA